MALTNWNDILNKPKGIDEVPEIALTVEQLSASVLSISEDVGEIALDVSQLSASVLSIVGDIEDIQDELTAEDKEITLNSTYFSNSDAGNAISCEKYDKLVILTISNLNLIAQINDTDHPVLISGLPIPKHAANYQILARPSSGGSYDEYRVRLSDDGTLNYWYNSADIPTTKVIAGQIIYLTN